MSVERARDGGERAEHEDRGSEQQVARKRGDHVERRVARGKVAAGGMREWEMREWGTTPVIPSERSESRDLHLPFEVQIPRLRSG